MTYEVRGTKGEHIIREQVHSLTKAEWRRAQYRAEGYETEIVEITPLTSGSR